MPEVHRLSAIGFQKGENSKDSPTDLKEGEWARLVNIEPGDEEAVIRGGVPLLRLLPMDGIDWAYPFRSTNKRKLFVGKRGVDLVQFDSNGGASVLKAGAFPVVSVTVCAERIGDAVIVACDYASGWPAYAVRARGSTLIAQTANIRRPTGAALSFTAPADAPGGTPTFPVKSCRMTAVTFIRRPLDEIGFDRAGNPRTTSVWSDAEAESWEDMAQRAYYAGIDAADASAQAVAIAIVGAIPADATHVRVWATQLTEWDTAGSAEAALQVSAGSSLRFLKDVSVLDFVGGAGVALIDKSEGQLAGEVNLSDTVGGNEIPPARQLKYFNGRMWATGARFGDSPGRSYYSNQITGLPSRSLSMFNLSDQFTDTSVDDTETTMGICASRGNLFFVNENDVWILRGGDPRPDNPPEQIAQGMGTTFPGTICENGQLAFYLSNQGPAVISGETVDLIEAFKVADVWPKSGNEIGYFFGLDVRARKKVRGFWFKDIWYITDGLVTVGYRVTSDGPTQGKGFRVELAEAAGIRAENFCKHSESEGYILSDASLCAWMDPNKLRDGSGYYFSASGRSRGMRIDGRRWYKMAEAYDILAMARWSDVGELQLTLDGQFGRVGDLFRYDERTIASPLQEGDIAPAYREVVQQTVPAYRLSSWFAAGFTKVIRGPFEISGLQVGILPRQGTEFEYISVSEAETIPAPDQKLAIFDDRFNSGEDG